ncbi:MAG TPA: ubiquitin-like small modifier protein 1 [Kribbellaceae bacterium]|jgi:molybdopterin converting factor small subunit
MAVVVRVPVVLRPYVGGADRVEVDGAGTVGAVFTALGDQHPALRRRITDDTGALRRHVNVFLGDDNIRDLSGLDTPVRDGDDLLVLPSIAGG